MARAREPNRDKAKEIWLEHNGEITNRRIAEMLQVDEKKIAVWKQRDKWNVVQQSETKVVQQKKNNKISPPNDDPAEERDELFLEAVKIVVDAQQASVSLLQRRLRIGYTRAARIIDQMEESNYVGPYQGDKPREVLLKELSPVLLMLMNTKAKRAKEQKPKEHNVPDKPLEQSINPKRLEKPSQSEPLKISLDLEEEDDELTERQRLFCIYYVRIFNATQSAIKAGYSANTAHVQGPRLLGNVRVSEEIKRLKAKMTNTLFVDAMDVLNKYVSIAFADMKDVVEFGSKEVPLMTKKGLMKDEDGNVITVRENFVALRDSETVDGTIIGEVKEGKDGISVKLLDKMKALEVLTKYFDLLPDKHRRMVEEERLKLDKERLELDKQKAAGEGDLDEELINDWVDGVMGDEPGQELKQEATGIQEENSDLPEES